MLLISENGYRNGTFTSKAQRYAIWSIRYTWKKITTYLTYKTESCASISGFYQAISKNIRVGKIAPYLALHTLSGLMVM